MILKRFYEAQIAQASYLVGCARTGEAIVIDPNLDTEQYIRAAEEEGLRITFVTETHIHADFISGSRTLSTRTGAHLLLSGAASEQNSYDFSPQESLTLQHDSNASGSDLRDRADLLRQEVAYQQDCDPLHPDKQEGVIHLHDGVSFRIGGIRLDVLHTPGHTPEHLAFLITDETNAPEPVGIFTGDLLFVGDVGRPDLMEKVGGQTGTMQSGARDLYRSLRRLRALPEYLIVWPGHGAGSACGKSLGGTPATSLGYEARSNTSFRIDSETAFIEMVLTGQPDPPRYFAAMKRINREAKPWLHDLDSPVRLPDNRISDLLDAGRTILDLRQGSDYAVRHIPGTVHIPWSKGFTGWAGSLLTEGEVMTLLASEQWQADAAARSLALIGFRPAGWFHVDALCAHEEADRALRCIPQISSSELCRQLLAGKVTVVDVRTDREWESGHLPDALHIPLGRLADRAGEIPTEKPVVVCCQSGIRSMIGASLLLRMGLRDVINLTGGMNAYESLEEESPKN